MSSTRSFVKFHKIPKEIIFLPSLNSLLMVSFFCKYRDACELEYKQYVNYSETQASGRRFRWKFDDSSPFSRLIPHYRRRGRNHYWCNAVWISRRLKARPDTAHGIVIYVSGSWRSSFTISAFLYFASPFLFVLAHSGTFLTLRSSTSRDFIVTRLGTYGPSELANLIGSKEN